MRRRIVRHRTQRGQISANVSSTKDTKADMAAGDAEEESRSDHKLKPEKLTEKRGTMDRGQGAVHILCEPLEGGCVFVCASVGVCV